jgi:hypothetical protein
MRLSGGVCARVTGACTTRVRPIPTSSNDQSRRLIEQLCGARNRFVGEKTRRTLSRQVSAIKPAGKFRRGLPTPGQFLIKSTIPGQAGMFMLIGVPGPYTDFSEFAHFIPDPSLRRKAEAQSCWLSVDLIAKITTAGEAYRFIGAVLAKLAPADAAVMVKPETNSAVLFDDDLRRQLASGSERRKD